MFEIIKKKFRKGKTRKKVGVDKKISKTTFLYLGTKHHHLVLLQLISLVSAVIPNEMFIFMPECSSSPFIEDLTMVQFVEYWLMLF